MGLVQPVDLLPPEEVGPVHFIAVGGAGMSGVAAAYAHRGVPVSGSDQADSDTLADLAADGVRTFVGHDPAQVGDARTVVVSSAIPASNVELAEARRRGLRVWHRSAALGALMLGRTGVAVTGTHGKTTTSGMVATMLAGVGADPSYVIGSPLASTGRSYAVGSGPAFVVEADESDGSFLQYPARIVVITNVETDHLDNWGTPERYRAGFVELGTAPGVDVVIGSADDPGSQGVLDAVRAAGTRVVTFGESPEADVRITGVEESPTHNRALLSADGDTGPLELTVPGRFNLLNAAAAYAVGRQLGHDGPALRAALAGFAGTHRRFEAVGQAGGISVFDDYAHHPTEVDAILTAARGRVAEGGRLVACFQPHLFSRTAEFADAFGAALTHADVVVLLAVYPARETQADFPGVTSELIADAVRARGREVTVVQDLAGAPSVLAGLVRPGDVVLTLGAGNITTVGPRLLAALRERG